MPIIGTAGHVDHGKSTLVQALTGRDPDRWEEEKKRGLTIDLGFAWTEIGDMEVGFVDVPGHERFIKNMLAGVGGIDVALFAVAADEGWMPQSEEHMAVLDLLDVHHGVIAVTRIDTTDPDVVDLAVLEISEAVEGTTLEGWEIVPTAVPTGRGLDELRGALARALAGAGPPRDTGRPRLWIDRAFSISGAGTVVTGTLVDGAIRRGDELVVWPGALAVRVRGLQSHERDVEVAHPGSRAAVNLGGIDRAQVARGAMLGRSDHFRTTSSFVADLRPVRRLPDPLTDRGAYHLHVGSATCPVRVRLLEGRELAGQAAALLQVDHPVPLVAGDRLILREVGRKAVVAGGVVLDPNPAATRRAALVSTLTGLRAAAGSSPHAIASALLDARGVDEIDVLARDSGGGTPPDALRAGPLVIAPAALRRLSEAIDAALRRFQSDNPMRPGMPKASVASAIGVPVSVVEAIVAVAEHLVDDGTTVRTADHRPSWDLAAKHAWDQARQRLRSSGLAVPRSTELGLDAEVLHALLREGRLVRVAEDLVFLPEQVDEILRRLDELEDGFTVAQFRDAMGMSRRQAVPTLEWLDAQGRTSRRGDVRIVRRRSSPGSGVAPPP